MRVEPHTVGSVMHIMKRGTRGMDIVRDDHDRYDFVRALFILNDTYQDNDWRRYTSGKPLFYRPNIWPNREPLISIMAWVLLNNHFHILAQERVLGGIAKFMQRLGGSMSCRFNAKYEEKGSLFQGGYKGRLVLKDEHLQYVHAYIVVKNTFEMFPGGLTKALSDFEAAWKFANTYPFSSFLTSSTHTPSPIIDMDAVDDFGLLRNDFKRFSKTMLMAHATVKEFPADIQDLILEGQ